MKRSVNSFSAAYVSLVALSGTWASTALAQQTESEPNDTPAQANDVGCNVVISGAISPAGEVDTFAFTLDQPRDVHVFTTIAPGNGNTLIDLIASDGTTLIETDDDSGDGLASQIGREAQAAGRYFVRVRPSGTTTATYTLTIRCPSYVAEVEPNGTSTTATPLPCTAEGGAGNITGSSDADCWSFTLDEPRTISALVLTAPANWDHYLTLLNSGFTSMQTSYGPGYELGARVTASLPAGTYYLRVSTGVNYPFRYDMSLLVEGRTCISFFGVTPHTGSSSGGDLVHVYGFGFGSASDLTVRFGGALGTIVGATPDRIDVRTPAGTGSVDVTVSQRSDSATQHVAFGYVPPTHAARYGNVNLALGDREDVLLVNALAGDEWSRHVTLDRGQPVMLTMSQPTNRPRATFVLYAWRGLPNARTLTVLRGGGGTMVFPPPFAHRSPQPIAIWDNTSHARTFGDATLPSLPAPSVIFRRTHGFRNPARVTFQGIIEDSGSPNRSGWSLTNAVILSLR
ncbi:MAG: IPT/TIG domain-containing protein [Planctomycetes bacterium]|nr:IPT/TIG domain-containing protein [Planctomycetota bacterium]MBI3847145.1 IPT/TIG domain-containing protein [Planctomycetota bacterium]